MAQAREARFNTPEAVMVGNFDLEDADSKLLDILEAHETPNSADIIRADCLFTAMIIGFNTKLETFSDQPFYATVCRFIINRANECKKWLLCYLYRLNGKFYVPTKGFGPIPNLDPVPHMFPHLDPRYREDNNDDMLNMLHVSRRLQQFLMRIILTTIPMANMDRHDLEHYARTYTMDLNLEEFTDLASVYHRLHNRPCP